MKRYWLFCGECHYGLGGMADFRSSFDTQEDAIYAAKTALIGALSWLSATDFPETESRSISRIQLRTPPPEEQRKQA